MSTHTTISLAIVSAFLIVSFAIIAGVAEGVDPAEYHAVAMDSRLRIDPVPAGHRPMYPLRVSANHRYLEDSTGQPFLIKGDAAWSLIAELKREDVDLYLRDRRSRGFNTILVSLIERRFATNAPANAYGDKPFLSPGHFDEINERYFAYADWVVRRAAAEGFLVLLAPCYTGGRKGSEGWYKEMKANGVDKLRKYGQYVGRRFSQFKNIIWVANGDYNAPDKSLVRAVVNGIRDSDASALFTSHNQNGTPGTAYWPGEDWIQLNNIYTWGPIYPDAVSQYRQKRVLPFILIEGQYENGPGITTQRLRAQAYQALLTGAAGDVFGNSPIWYFDGTDEFPVPPGWQAALDGPGSRSMAHLHEIFAHLPWSQLQPDVSGEFLVGGQGRGLWRAVAARSRSGSMAVVYIPEDRTVSLNLGRLNGTSVHAYWYDPASGAAYDAVGSKFPAHGLGNFRPLKKNSSGSADWLLILQTTR